ncbi:MAG: UDP-3-O-(3-hydroxymyristoyl)glucosamine N-acyltransferase [Phycisphaerales bacterium]
MTQGTNGSSAGGSGAGGSGAAAAGVKATSGQLAAMLKGELVGPADVVLSGFGPIEMAGPTDLTFIRNDRYAHQWGSSRAGAAVVSRSVKRPEVAAGRALIIVDDADLAMITLMNMLKPPRRAGPAGIHGTAIVDAGVRETVPASATIGPFCVVGAGCRLGEGVVLTERVSLGANVSIGAESVLRAGVVVYDGCEIGSACIVHANAVIGADGFGYRPATEGGAVVKVPHMSHVVLGDDVEIGANSCIDRGKFRPTTIASGTKIDNLVQIGHGVRIGKNTLICGCTGVAGSVTIGEGVMIGGHAGITDNITVGDHARIGAFTAVMGPVPAGETHFGVPSVPARQAFRQIAILRKFAGLDRKTLAAKHKDGHE